MGKLWKRILFWWRRERFESEMEEELRFHLDMKTQDGVEAGLARQAAHYRALRQFGNTLKIREQSREVWILAALETLAQDLHYGFRMLWKSPSFTAMSLLGLGLGIGLSTTVFTLVNALMQPLRQMKDPATCLLITKSNHDNFSFADYAYLRDHNTVLTTLGAYSGWVDLIANLRPSGEPEEVRVRLVAADHFKVYGDEPSPGRAFLPEEDRTPGSHPVAILGRGFWQSRFGADPGVIGKSLRLNGDLFTVVGVSPGNGGDSANIYLPLAMRKVAMAGTAVLQDPTAPWLTLAGRLRNGVSVEQAQAELTALLNGLREARSEKDAHTTVIVTPGGVYPGKKREMVIGMFSAMLVVGMILLIACMNTANLLLARAAARRREICVRLSLGASRGRLIRQLLTESVLLALLAGVIGTLLSIWLTHGFKVYLPPLESLDMSLDGRVFAYVLLITLGTGVAFGLAPALEASRPDLASATKAPGAPGRRTSLWAPRNALVVGPLAISLMLLAGAGLILEFLHKNYVRNTSVNAENLLAIALKLDRQGYDENRASLFQQQLISRLEKIPGVRSVALTRNFPLANDDISMKTIRIQGFETPPDGRLPRAAYNIVSPNYFSTIGIPVLRGRGFTLEDSEAAPGVALINENMARKFWPTEDPIGKRFRLGNAATSYQVVGIAKDIWDDGLALPQPPFIYVSNLQADQFHETAQLKFLIRGEGGPGIPRRAILPALRGVVRSLDSKLWVLTGTLGDVADSALRAPRIAAVLSSALGSLAMLLAALGIYGVMAYAVSQRTQEIGIRMALGAQKRDVLGLVLGRSVALIVLGIAWGLAGAFALSRVVSGFIAEVGGLEPLAFAAVSTLLAAVAMLASYVPARRAAKVDPMVALRYE